MEERDDIQVSLLASESHGAPEQPCFIVQGVGSEARQSRFKSRFCVTLDTFLTALCLLPCYKNDTDHRSYHCHRAPVNFYKVLRIVSGTY